MPVMCRKNGLEVDEVPECLARLNWLELLTIRRIRPITVKTFDNFFANKSTKSSIRLIPKWVFLSMIFTENIRNAPLFHYLFVT